MKISYMSIKNFKSIKELVIDEMDYASIFVGKNNTGKTTIIDAILLMAGQYNVTERDYCERGKSIYIKVTLDIDENDLQLLNQNGVVSKYRKYDLWYEDFCNKLPSYNNGQLTFEYVCDKDRKIKYRDGTKNNNKYIVEVLPKIYYIDHTRDASILKNDIFKIEGNKQIVELQESACMFNKANPCVHCFNCIGLINKKEPEALSIFEAARLLEYKIYNINISNFTEKLNNCMHKNCGNFIDINYEVNLDIDSALDVNVMAINNQRNSKGSIDTLSEGLRSIYIFSLLEAYVEDDDVISSIILIEDPEIFLHPQLQKTASEILFRLAKKNQVIFSTHSPNMIFNFSSKQIKQVLVDENGYTRINENTNIDYILDDLGYTANDLMNVSFVFIVEGKQDSNRLPLLLEKYYSEIYDADGNLQRISIIPVNSCTNIKTYANLKYINKLYLKDQFLMIRDSDGKPPESLVRQLCSYYGKRMQEDAGNLPRITKRNVLVLKYYSFENYFLDPKTMVKIGVINTEEEFYNILYKKYRDYLYKLGSTKRMLRLLGIRISSKNDIKNNIENIKTYVRGHNLFDIYYGKYKREAATEILKRYIEEAPREVFANILDAIDSFVYFENRKKDE